MLALLLCVQAEPSHSLPACTGLPLGELAPVCLATAADRDRILSVLPRLSRSWPGSLSAAVLTREPLNVEETAFSLTALADAGACAPERVAITLVDGERFTTPALSLFPHNLLRNLALRACEDPYVLMLDADFELMPPLSARALREETRRWLAPDSGRRLAIVLPSFNLRGRLLRAWLDRDARDAPFAHKAGLRELCATKGAWPFNAHVWPRGVQATDYAQWLPAQQLNESYLVRYEDGWEPYLLLRRNVALRIPYDTSFVGYGLDKLSHVEELHAAGTAFRVSAGLYVVHTHSHAMAGLQDGRTSVARAQHPRRSRTASESEPGTTCLLPQLRPLPDDTGAACMHVFYCRLKRQL